MVKCASQRLLTPLYWRRSPYRHPSLLKDIRLRLLLLLLIWVASLFALALWVSGRQQVELTLAAGPVTSETYRLAQAIAEELSESGRLRIRVFETGGSIENMDLLETGQVDLATVQAAANLPDEAMGVARLYADAFHLVVNTDAGIGHFADLAGHRVAIPPESSAQHPSFWFLAEHYGLDAASLEALPMSADAANFAMLQGQMDAVFRVRAPGNPTIRELISSGKMEIIESRSHLVARYSLAGQMAPLQDDADSVIPAHPGARQYFDREKPGLLAQNARLASALLYVVVLVGSGLIALRARWLRSRRLRMGDFNARLMEIAQSARACSAREQLLEHKNHLMDILGEVVNDLDAERVSQEEFEHFSFTWQAVDALVRDQLLLLGIHVGESSHG